MELKKKKKKSKIVPCCRRGSWSSWWAPESVRCEARSCGAGDFRHFPSVGVDGDGHSVRLARLAVDGDGQPGDEQSSVLRPQFHLDVDGRVWNTFGQRAESASGCSWLWPLRGRWCWVTGPRWCAGRCPAWRSALRRDWRRRRAGNWSWPAAKRWELTWPSRDSPGRKSAPTALPCQWP